MQRVAFKLGQTNSQAGLEFDTGSGSGYFRVAVYENGGKLYQALAYPSGGGTTYVNPTVLVDAFQANTWYVLEVTANDGAGSRVSVWAESAPNTRYEARWGMPTGQAWTFRGWVYTSGTLLWLDDYREEQGLGLLANVRVAGRHYEYDYATNVQTKRYYAEGKLVATRSIPNANPSAQTLRYVQSDHLGSTSTLTDASGQVVARERYSAFGERRRGEMPLTTDQLYTSQQYNSLSSLYYYSDGKSAGRFYDPLLARFIQPDNVVARMGSLDLNRYAYVYNNPQGYTDANGHCVLCGDWVSHKAYSVGREIRSAKDVNLERLRRDQVGGQLVMGVSATIDREASQRSVDGVLVKAILRHESSALERRLTEDIVGSANSAEGLQALAATTSIGPLGLGDLASIGPGQMQLRRARELERMGYVPARSNDYERIQALLGEETSVSYVSGMVQYLSDKLHTIQGFDNLSKDNQGRLILLGYNRGWDLLQQDISEKGFEKTIDAFQYDNQTLDEYQRWSGTHE
ncbi:MAG: RHS repeat-associated core domain-containing protein [Anaerolineae bacterium]